PRAIAVHFIEGSAHVRLAVRAEDVLRRQDQELAATVVAGDRLRAQREAAAEVRAAVDVVLREPQVIPGLRFLIVHQGTDVAAPAVVRDEREERGKDEIRGLPILFRTAEEGEVIPDATVGEARIEHVGEDLAPVGFHVVEDRRSVEPVDQAEEIQHAHTQRWPRWGGPPRRRWGSAHPAARGRPRPWYG